MHTTVLLLTAVVVFFCAPVAHAVEGAGLTTTPQWKGRILLGTASSNNVLSLGASTEKSLGNAAGLTVRSFSVMGDYYFAGRTSASADNANSGSRNPLNSLGDLLGGGFRATSGLLVGPRNAGYASVNAAGSAAGLAAGSVAGSVASSVAGSVLAARKISIDLRSGYALTSDQAASEASTVPYLGLGYTGGSVKGGWGFSADVGVMALNPSSAVKLGRVLGGGQSLDDTLREMRVSPVLQLGVSYSF